MEITLNHIIELMIGLAVFLVLINIIYSAVTSLYQKQSQQELILDKINDRLPFIERGTCRTVIFDIDEFNFVIFTPDHPKNSPACSKVSPCGCVSFPKTPKDLGCKNLALKNKCDDDGLCYEEMQELKVIKRTLKICADERGQLTYG